LIMSASVIPPANTSRMAAISMAVALMHAFTPHTSGLEVICEVRFLATWSYTNQVTAPGMMLPPEGKIATSALGVFL
jgi:hypothetical protein